MGSASREALAAAKSELSDLGSAADLTTGEQLFEAARVLGGSSQMRSALSDPSADQTGKQALVARVFAPFGEPARRLLAVIAGKRWSSPDDLVAGVEELGIRAIVASAPYGVSIESELHSFATAIASSPDLELALGSKLSGTESKVQLVQRLIEGKAAQETIVILRQLVGHPRGRRIPELMRYAAAVVSDQNDFTIATVTVAHPVAREQMDRLGMTLARQYGRRIAINLVVDPGLIGGMRVQVADDVIDGSIAARINDLKLQLAS